MWMTHTSFVVRRYHRLPRESVDASSVAGGVWGQAGWGPGQPGLWKVSLPRARGWNWMEFKGPPNPSHSIIWFFYLFFFPKKLFIINPHTRETNESFNWHLVNIIVIIINEGVSTYWWNIFRKKQEDKASKYLFKLKDDVGKESKQYLGNRRASEAILQLVSLWSK